MAENNLTNLFCNYFQITDKNNSKIEVIDKIVKYFHKFINQLSYLFYLHQEAGSSYSPVIHK